MRDARTCLAALAVGDLASMLRSAVRVIAVPRTRSVNREIQGRQIGDQLIRGHAEATGSHAQLERDSPALAGERAPELLEPERVAAHGLEPSGSE